MTEHERFLAEHGVRPGECLTNYHYSYALYAWYMIESMQMAEDIEDGLCFDEVEAALLLEGLAKAHKAMRHFRCGMQEPYAEFDVAETVAMKGCRLESGKLAGNGEEAGKIARTWVDEVGQQAFLFRGGSLHPFSAGPGSGLPVPGQRKGGGKICTAGTLLCPPSGSQS